MTAAGVPLRTVLGIDRGYLKYVFIDMPFMKRMQMAVVEIVDMIVMFDCCVAAASAVLVGMILVDCMCGGHGLFSFLSKLPVELK
jgi:hypothetical protein